MLQIKNIKEIPEYEGLYSCSEDGEVWSHKSKKWLIKVRRGRGLRFHVDLCKLGKIKSFPVSRILASTYLGLDISNKKILVCHKDDIPDNNELDNLFLGTAKENSQDMVRKGRQGGFKNRGENNGMSKLSNEQVTKIKSLISSGKKGIEISQIFGCSPATISEIKNNKKRISC